MIKQILRLFTFAAVVLFVVVQIVVRRYSPGPVIVRFKSEAELATLPTSADSYPCLLVDRARTGASAPLRAALRQCSPALNNDADIEQYEVDLRSGLFVLRRTDIFVPDSMPLVLTRAYRLWDNQSRAFGTGGNHPYDIFPIGTRFPYTYMNLILGDGAAVHYSRISQGTSYVDFVAEHSGAPPIVFQKSRIRWNVDHWDLTFQGGTLYRFPEAYLAKRGADGALIGMSNPQGERITIVRDPRHNLKSLASPHQRRIQFLYDERDRIQEAAADNGDVTNYQYDQTGNLSEVRKNGHVVWRYGYDATGMTRVQDSSQQDILSNRYVRGRLASLTLNKTLTYYFDYLLARNGSVVETVVTDPSGTRSVFKF